MSKEDLKNWKQEGEKKVANDLHDILVKLDGTRWMIAKKQKKNKRSLLRATKIGSCVEPWLLTLWRKTAYRKNKSVEIWRDISSVHEPG